ncbi:MAG: insulinase family protein [Butyrivibrio sp.]|nr:insulinase family protein [Butyrivibrio sp.]
MKFDSGKYELLKEERIEELKSDGFLLRHRKSGARVLLMSNDDDNKVFCIGFRTPPPDSTGVPHILEHSVLCGSAKYPAKDPFIELAKGSLNTFLNAMTYPDKTMYPVASCNDADFKNLTDVYMDAVLHPNIYTREEIFRQEGWHYELESVDAPLQYNGVVYNEMKGAFSSPDDVLARYCLNSLYPDTSYGVESGGDPACIPDLSYEDFVGFHKKLYHPSNSYIYIYGDCDMEERLEYLDREYLSKYDAISVDSEIAVQKPFDSMQKSEAEYSVTEDEGCEGKTYLAYNVSVGSFEDKELYLAARVLDYALFSAPGAPVKQALIDAGIGEDIMCYYESDLRQPMYTIAAKNTDADKEERFLSIIRDTLSGLVENGINKDALLAGINTMEFSYREADFGRFPKGLMYGLSLMGTWLYDEERPFDRLAQNASFEFLKSNVGTGYFEGLVKKYFLDNKHASLVVLHPAKNLTARTEAETAAKLAGYKASLAAEELEALVNKTKALKEYQSEPSTEEELRSIPLLSREDISREVQPLYNDILTVGGVTVDRHNIYTNGIGYMNLSFDIANVGDGELPYVGLLGEVIGYISTSRHSFDELSNEVDKHTGGIFPDFATYRKINDFDDVSARFSVRCKALSGEYKTALELIREMMFESKFDDGKRLKEILAEVKLKLQSRLLANGHSTAVNECCAQFDKASRYGVLTSGVAYYNFIAGLYDNFDSRREEITAALERMTERIFVKDRLIVSFTGDDEVYDEVKPWLEAFADALPDGGFEPCARNFSFEKKRIGYKTASQVNYVARCGDFTRAGIKYSPSLKVLKTILGYDYLWLNVRVKGGAYGCMNGYGISGTSFFCSYRDPNVTATDEIYDGIEEYVRSFDANEREMTKYIIGTFSEIDTPLTPSGKGGRSFDSYLRGADEEYYKKDRLGVLETTKDDINALADTVKAVLDGGYLCVVGNGDKIEEESRIFDEVKSLF